MDVLSQAASMYHASEAMQKWIGLSNTYMFCLNTRMLCDLLMPHAADYDVKQSSIKNPSNGPPLGLIVVIKHTAISNCVMLKTRYKKPEMTPSLHYHFLLFTYLITYLPVPSFPSSLLFYHSLRLLSWKLAQKFSGIQLSTRMPRTYKARQFCS